MRLYKRVLLALVVLCVFVYFVAPAPSAFAASNSNSITFSNGATGHYQCGSGNNAVKVSINIGCYGASCQSNNKDGCSAIIDATFAIIRALSAGVGVVVVASVVWAGIQYSMSRGDPSATAKAVTRLRETLIALLVFIFGYAILNYLIPAGFFK
ncbi:MAG TPA: hypothetical protein VJP80_07650 [Candidatus Saccharimonadales bacterium]|nr:hypothetical protein [Candidatus Saccharimonadales bacterium]